jgi:hypothetical protein
MMKPKGCNQRYRDLLHAYELGILSDEEREEFEIHYLECDNCYKRVKEFEQEAMFLRQDHDIYETAGHLVDRSQTRIQSRLLKRIGVFWGNLKEQYVILRPAAVVATILILAVPTYFLIRGFEEKQVIELVAMRGITYETIDLEKGGKIEIRFLYSGAQRNKSYSLQISSFNDDVIHSNHHVTQFDPGGIGKVNLSADAFKTGFYKLILADSKGESLIEYFLKAE